MSNILENADLNMMDIVLEPEDYKGEDGLLYCGKCHTPKGAYFSEGKNYAFMTGCLKCACLSASCAATSAE